MAGEAFCPKDDEGNDEQELSPEHPSHVRLHFSICAPELLRSPIVGHHPNSVYQKVSHPQNDKGDDYCENKTLGVHITDRCKDFRETAQANAGLPSSCAAFKLIFLGGSTIPYRFNNLFSRGGCADDCCFARGHLSAGTI